MAVYKKTCESGKVYYGSTSNDIKIRENKGHYNCSCKDFINPVMEVLEYIDDPKLRYERELYYIKNFDCVNTNGKGFDRNKYMIEYNKRDYVKEYRKKQEEKRMEKFKCPNCDKMTNKKHLSRHQKSKYCINYNK